MSPDGTRAWASGGGQDVVHAYAVGSPLREVATIPVPSFPAGIAYGTTPHGDRLYVANNLAGRAGDTNPPGRTVTVIDPATNAVTNVIDLGMAAQPLGVTFDRTGAKAYVTQWLGRSVSVIDTATETTLRQITLSPATNPLQADHPSAIAANPKRDEVYTANANSDTVSVIDTRTDGVAATIDVSLTPDAREGAMPDGLTVSPDGKRLYVALAGENALAVIDVARRKVIGFIPTAWYPVDVDITRDGGRLVVTGANRVGDRPNRCAGPYAVGDCSSGDLIYADIAADGNSTQTMTKGVVNVIKTPRTHEAAAPPHGEGDEQQPRARAAGAHAELPQGDQARDLRRQGEPHLRPGARRPRQGRRRPQADAVPRGLRAQPPRARAALHAVRQLLRRRRRLGRRAELGRRRRRDRLHEQDLADLLLALAAQVAPRARLREPLDGRADPDRAARPRRDRVPHRRRADARLPVGQRLRQRRLVPQLRHVHDDPRRLHGRRQHVDRRRGSTTRASATTSTSTSPAST